MEEKRRKIKVICKVLNVFMWIAFVATIVGTVALICVNCLIMAFGTEPFKWFMSQGLELDGEIIAFLDASTWQMISMLVIYAVRATLVCICFYIAIGIFRDISETGRPFELSNAKRIKRIAILILVMNVIPTVSSGSLGASSSLDFNVPGVITGIIYIALSRVFEYGCELQKEADETV